MTLSFDGTVIVPVADPDDGERTAAALEPYLGPSSTVIAINVIEKAGGGPDKASVEQREEHADDIFRRVRETLDDAPGALETRTVYGTDVVERIFETAREERADAVVFSAREGNRLAEFLTGDVARRLVKEATVPVVALPRASS
ncbi:universal stress protein [Natronococcus wangiae]|uniref:universal stress protein n=1 Tax=Natronococcus wangiae TaxID=3068275 RepID=UPI00273DD344|nr:universal stress protein [Natronococcus sp. AD5]